MLIQFSPVNNVLDPPASHFDSFLTRDIVLLAFTSKEVFCTNVMFLILEHPVTLAVFISYFTSLLTGKICS
jgi:hypothetical protein